MLKKPFFRVALWLGCVYIALLIGIYAYGNLNFGYLSEIHPNQSLTNPPGAFKWFSAYRQFMEYSIMVLALLMGAWTALLGVIRKSFLLGVGSLVAGVAVTAMIYGLLPRIYFLGIDFTAWGYWLAFGFYAYIGSWVIITLLGYILSRKLIGKN